MSVETPPPPPETTVAPARPRRPRAIAIGLGAVALAAGVWLVATRLPRLLTSDPNATPPAAAGAPAADARQIHATLFYVSDEGTELVPASRDVPYGATPTEQARLIVEAQVKAPTDGHVSAIPPATTVRMVYLTTAGVAYVDFGPEIAATHSGGSLNESLAVYAIVHALTFNLPGVSAVQILVNGQDVDTLAGHLDLRRPIGKSLAWVKKGQ
jgi:hypothetical protein